MIQRGFLLVLGVLAVLGARCQQDVATRCRTNVATINGSINVLG